MDKGEEPSRLARVAQSLVETVSALGGADAVPSLQQIVDVGLRTVPAADSVSMTQLRNGRFVTTAATGDLSRRGDELQYSLGSGPCVDAVLDDAVYRPKDLAHDPTWPTYGSRASRELGISSMLSFRLFTDSDEAIDGLNFYSRETAAFDDDDLLQGLLVATQAALALTRTKARHLAKALEHSREIGAAVGILMSAHKVTFDEAFDLLRVASQNLNRPVRDIAADVVETGTLEIPRRPGRD